MSGHTKGPWIAGKFSSVVGWPVVAQTGRVICDVAWMAHLPREGGLFEETEANARLIAAAPKLLAALKNLVPRFESCAMAHGNDRETVESSSAQARAAIAEAE